MNVRVPFEWLIVFSVVAGSTSVAQDWLPPQPVTGLPDSSMAPIQYGPPGSPGTQDYFQSFSSPPPSQQDVYAQLLPDDRGWAYDHDSRIDLRIRQMLEDTWIRVEYLGGTLIRDAGRTLGEPINAANPAVAPGPAGDVADPSQQFQVLFTPVTTGTGNRTPIGNQIPLAQVPTTHDLSWKHAQGIRGSFGIPVTDNSWIEGRFWSFGNVSASIPVDGFPPSPNTNSVLITNDTSQSTFIGSTTLVMNPALFGANSNIKNSLLATTLTTNGQPGSTMIVYDTSFHSLYSAQLWAADADIVFNLITPERGFRLLPILGYRHEEYSERFSFGGTFLNQQVGRVGTTLTTAQTNGYLGQTLLANPVSNSIASNVYNYRDQIEFGARNEFKTRWVTLGAEERFGLGSNIIRSEVAVQNVRNPGNPTISDPANSTTKARDVIFAPTFDLELYTKVTLTNWCNFRIGWNMVWMGDMGVSDQSIRFNEVSNATGGTDADVSARIGTRNRVISALTIGGEIILP